MDENSVDVIDTTSDQAATAAPEPVVTPDEQDTGKSFSEEELERIVQKRLDRAQRKWEREQSRRTVEVAPPAPLPPVDSFADAQSYAEAMAEQKAQELLARRDAVQQQTAVLDAYHDREEEARVKYDDFEQVAYNPNLRVTDAMAQTIQASDIGPDVIYYLGTNPKESERIARLPVLLQAKEIGKLEAKLVSDPPVKRTSTAPAPIAPVTARTSGSNSYDTTDPRSIKSMSTSEWIEAERQRQIRKYEAANRR
jgi:hypothetical protein